MTAPDSPALDPIQLQPNVAAGLSVAPRYPSILSTGRQTRRRGFGSLDTQGTKRFRELSRMGYQNAEGGRTFAELSLSVNQVDETKSMLICENRKHTEIA